MSSRPIVAIASAALLTSASAMSVARVSAAPPVPPKAAAPAAPIPITRLAALAGTWQGFVGESFVEEIWSSPQGNTIMGCFRWCDANRNPTMFEMLAIREEPDAIRLRLRHYSPTLVGKEEKDAPITMRLASAEGSVFLFEAEKHAGDLASVRYEVTGEGDRRELLIEVAFTSPADAPSPRPPLRFRLKRV
jgi:hypothetical protein